MFTARPRSSRPPWSWSSASRPAPRTRRPRPPSSSSSRRPRPRWPSRSRARTWRPTTRRPARASASWSPRSWSRARPTPTRSRRPSSRTTTPRSSAPARSPSRPARRSSWTSARRTTRSRTTSSSAGSRPRGWWPRTCASWPRSATNDVVMDPGCGDAIMLITAVEDAKAKRAIGTDIDPKMVKTAQEAVKAAKLEDKITIKEGNALELKADDLKDVTVVMLYMGNELNIRLRPTLWEHLKPGSRIVSHRFIMGDWKPDKSITVNRVGDYGEEDFHLHVWTITGKEKTGRLPEGGPEDAEPVSDGKPRAVRPWALMFHHPQRVTTHDATADRRGPGRGRGGAGRRPGQEGCPGHHQAADPGPADPDRGDHRGQEAGRAGRRQGRRPGVHHPRPGAGQDVRVQDRVRRRPEQLHPDHPHPRGDVQGRRRRSRWTSARRTRRPRTRSSSAGCRPRTTSWTRCASWPR